MNDDGLGLNHLLSLPATCHTVRPPSFAASSGHLSIAPPKSSSANPKCFLYHAAKAAWSPLLLKKTPPIPVTFAMSRLCAELSYGTYNRRIVLSTRVSIHAYRNQNRARIAFPKKA